MSPLLWTAPEPRVRFLGCSPQVPRSQSVTPVSLCLAVPSLWWPWVVVLRRDLPEVLQATYRASRKESYRNRNMFALFESTWNPKEFVRGPPTLAFAFTVPHSAARALANSSLHWWLVWHATHPWRKTSSRAQRCAKPQRSMKGLMILVAPNVGEAFIKDQDHFDVFDARPTFIQLTGKLTPRLSRKSRNS